MKPCPKLRETAHFLRKMASSSRQIARLNLKFFWRNADTFSRFALVEPMKRSSHVMALLALFSACGLLACKESKFNATSGARQPAATPDSGDAQIPEPRELLEQSFDLTKSGGKLDIVWAIDTSGSMREEAAHVQQNFNRFASSLSSRSDVRFATIATRSSGGNIGVDLGSTSSDRVQIDVGVGSTNALALIAAAVCPPESTSITGGRTSSGGTLCGQPLTGLEAGGSAARIAGQLRAFLRPEAKPVFVIVTDDNARGVTSSNVLEMIKPHLNNQEPIFYAFRGQQSRSGCNVANRGVDYEALASSTGGQVFDICEPDWSPNFTLLSKAVAELGAITHKLREDVESIQKVSIDGRELRESDYVLKGRTIEIKKGVVSSTAKTLLIQWYAPEA